MSRAGRRGVCLVRASHGRGDGPAGSCSPFSEPGGRPCVGSVRLRRHLPRPLPHGRRRRARGAPARVQVRLRKELPQVLGRAAQIAGPDPMAWRFMLPTSPQARPASSSGPLLAIALSMSRSSLAANGLWSSHLTDPAPPCRAPCRRIQAIPAGRGPILAASRPCRREAPRARTGGGSGTGSSLDRPPA